jgi:hypothetical protein
VKAVVWQNAKDLGKLSIVLKKFKKMLLRVLLPGELGSQ